MAFNSGGGSGGPQQQVLIGDLTLTPEDPTLEGSNYEVVVEALGDGNAESPLNLPVTRSWTGSAYGGTEGANIYPSPNDTTSSLTTFTFVSPGTYFIQCTASYGLASDNPQTQSIVVLVTELVVPETYGAYQTIEVYPNPEDLNIPTGSVPAFTVRRKIEKNNTVIVHTPVPTGSRGSNTISGGGFLIPEDLSEIQKENVKIIINNLHSKNAFPTPENITE